MAPRPASIKVRALQWLAQREYSRDELRTKLLRLLQRQLSLAGAREDRGEWAADRSLPSPSSALAELSPNTAIDPMAEVDALLLWLEAHAYLSQARFVESRVHARQSRFGNLRIRQELRQHGVTLDADAQQALQRSEFDRACEVWRKKYGGPADDPAARLRQMRFLAGRGFSIDVVRRVLKSGAVHDVDEADSPTS